MAICIPKQTFEDTIRDLEEKQKKNDKLKETLSTIQLLPPTVSKQIYEDYITKKELCKEFLKILLDQYDPANTNEWDHLKTITVKILKYPCVVHYLRKKLEPFNRSYVQHYEMKESADIFHGLTTIESFLLYIVIIIYP